VDAVQALGLVPFRVAALGADSIAVSAHKLHGPKGAGALWLAPRARVAPLWDGGRQEHELRSGTENLPAVAGFACAVALAAAARDDGALGRVAALRDALEAGILTGDSGAAPTVKGGPRAPHIASFALPGLPAEPLLHALEARSVIASAGSACASRTRGPSHVLKALGVAEDTAVLRFSLSRETTPAEIEQATAAFHGAVAEIREVAGPRRPSSATTRR
jgi:cysteine desulfurase